MIKNELKVLKNKILNGSLHRDIDEAYADGVWDYAIQYIKKHHLNSHHALSPQDIDIITNVLYDFIYDLLDSELN